MVFRRSLVTLIVVSVGAFGAGKKVAKPENTFVQTFPDTYLNGLDNGKRFKDPAYFKLMASDGLRGSDPKGLFQRITAAVEAGQNYKALYLARLFTQLKPDVQQGWVNRSSIAATLGYREEAALAQANAESSPNARPVPPSVLPGTIRVRPKDLSDWGAALALLSDDLTAKEGAQALISIRDDVTGIQVSTPEEVAKEAQESASDGLPPTGPWARPKPLLLSDIAPNMFSMRGGEPMRESSTNGGSLAGALLMSGLAGMQKETASATQAAAAAGAMMEKANSVPSIYKSGRYLGVTYVAGDPKTTTYLPKPSGKYDAIGNPLPIIWASGGSMSSAVFAQVVSSGKVRGTRIGPEDAGKTQDKNLKKKQRLNTGTLPPLYYPRLAAFQYPQSDGKTITTWPFTLLELMLDQNDLDALLPNSQVKGLTWYEENQEYSRGRLVFINGNYKFGMAGYDSKGATYIVRCKETSWLMPVNRGSVPEPPSGPKAKKERVAGRGRLSN